MAAEAEKGGAVMPDVRSTRLHWVSETEERGA